MKYLSIISLITFLCYTCRVAGQDTLYYENVDEQLELSIPNITSINKDRDGNIWITTLSGIYRYDGYDIVKYISNENENHGLIKDITFRSHVSKDGSFWIAGSYLIYKYDPLTERLIRMSEYDRINFTFLYEISYFDIEDIDSTHMAVASKSGLRIYDRETQRMTGLDSLVSTYHVDRYSTNAHVLQIERDPSDDNILWLLTKNGLYTFDCRTWSTEQVFYDKKIEFDKLYDRGFSMVHKENFIYLLINFKKLYKFDKTRKEIKQIDQKYLGIRPGHIRNLLPAKDGFYITYIGNGIYNYVESMDKIIPIENRFIDGEDYHSPSYSFLDESNRIISVHNNKTLVISHVPNTKRSTQKLFTKSLSIGKFPFEDTIKNLGLHKLETYQRDISFDVGLTNKEHFDKESYFYKFKEKSDWKSLEGNNIVLKDLSAGRHDIYVKITSGGLSHEGIVKSFDVKPFFYERTWFFLLIGLGLIGIASIISYLINIRKKDKKQYQVKMFELEMNALRSQMNPHFLFNSINSIKSYVIAKDKVEAAEYLTQFAKLIRMILENSRKKYLSIAEESEMLRLYAIMEQKRLNFAFDFTMDVDQKIDDNFLVAPMLIQPYLENAIWHGLMNKYGDKKLLVRFEVFENGVLVTVKDNGIGRVASEKLNAENRTSKKSLGLKITEDRLEIIKKMYRIDASVDVIDLYDKQNNPTGTLVKIFLPEVSEII